MVQPEYVHSRKCQLLMFWLVSIYACVLFYGECVRTRACVCGRVCQLHDLQCVSVLSRGMLQSHVHGPVMWLSRFAPIPLLCLVNLLATI